MLNEHSVGNIRKAIIFVSQIDFNIPSILFGIDDERSWNSKFEFLLSLGTVNNFKTLVDADVIQPQPSLSLFLIPARSRSSISTNRESHTRNEERIYLSWHA